MGGGDAELFSGAAWVVAADDGLDLDVWRDVAELAWACGARVVPAAADEHDLAVARVSHLPHLLAAVLAAVGAGERATTCALALAASSFADGTRVAGTRPELVLAMCEGNRDALLAAVDDALGPARARCAARWPRPAAWPRRCRPDTGPEAVVGDAATRWAPVVADGDPAVLAELRELGRRGEVVTGWRLSRPSGAADATSGMRQSRVAHDAVGVHAQFRR